MVKLPLLAGLLATAASVSAQPARVDVFGSGCVSGAVSFYELFSAGTFDLSGAPTNSILLTPLVNGYLVAPGSNTFTLPSSAGLALTDDSLSPVLPLGFTFNFPGGSTPDIKICSNGFIYLNNTGTSISYTPTVTDVLSGGPRVFLPWSDWLPDGAANTNNVYYETGTGFARATWLNVREFASSGTATMQCTFSANGDIEIAWQAVNATTHVSLLGFSPGAGNRDPGNRDISATLPFATRTDSNPLTQNADRPVMGTNVFLRVTDIPPGSLGGVEFLGTLLNPGLDLSFLGMPTCSLYINPLFVTVPFATGGPTANVGPLAIANRPSLIGFRLTIQAVTLTPGINAFGVASSNAATLVFGTN